MSRMAKEHFLLGFSLFCLFFLLISSFTVLSVCNDQGTIDLEINSTVINFSNLKPIEGELVTINGTITNNGDKNAQNVVVQFLDDSSGIGNTTVNVSCNSTAIAVVNWTAQIGPNNITLIIDPQDLITETNETNNNATQNITLGSYSLYVGNIFAGYVVLGSASMNLFSRIGSSANVLAVDSDSVVNFDSLQALGIKKSGGSSSNDFGELDTLLNTTSFNDSVTSRWSSDGSSARWTTSLRVGSQFISSVPIINSTNTSSFVTGVLWDTSTDTNGEFDSVERENIVFITNVNSSKMGLYGIYDYEFLVPSLLRSYTGVTQAVDFYLDVR